MAFFSIRKRKPKLVFLLDVSSVDEVDGWPTRLRFGSFEVFFLCASMLAYIFDFCSDVVVSIFYLRGDEPMIGLLILSFALLSSAIVNVIGLWFFFDNPSRSEADDRREPRLLTEKPMVRILAAFCLLGPLIWLVDAVAYGLRFRRHLTAGRRLLARECYGRMVDADRDATILKLFEAFLESAPQLIIQGFLTIRLISAHPAPTVISVVIHGVSILFGLSTVSSAIVMQHRCLRLARQDKLNLRKAGLTVMFLWRFLTVSVRVMCLSLFVAAYGHWIGPFFALHFTAAFVYLLLNQRIDLQVSCCAQSGLFAICSFIYIFMPYNIAEGKTRWLYFSWYALEFTENLILVCSAYFHMGFQFAYWRAVFVMLLGGFFGGICSMLVYYKCFHPNLYEKREEEERDCDSGEEEIGEVEVRTAGVSLAAGQDMSPL